MRILVIVLLIGFSCTQASDQFNGSYTFANELKGLEHRNWNAEFWTLEVGNDKGRLVFTDAARGLYSFDLSVSVTRTENRISIHFDSIVRDGIMTEEKLDTLQKGEKLFEIVFADGKYTVPSENITRLQYRELRKGIAAIERRNS